MKKYIGSGVIGAVIGLLGGLYSAWSAEAAIEVRPNLANVGLVDASLTGHGLDWLYFHYTIPMILFAMIFMAVVLTGVVFVNG